MEDLVSATKATDVKLHNAVNEFMLLSNLQFVENVSGQQPFTPTPPTPHHTFWSLLRFHCFEFNCGNLPLPHVPFAFMPLAAASVRRR